MFDRTSRLPIDNMFQLTLKDPNTGLMHDDFVLYWKKEMEEAFSKAKRQENKVTNYNTNYYNNKIKFHEALTGDKVLVRNNSEREVLEN